MAEKLIKPVGLLIFFALICSPLYPAADQADASYKSLRKLYNNKNKDAFEKEGNLFLKNFPSSSHVPEVRIMLADKESDLDIALAKYRSVIKNYSRFQGREEALYKICQLLDLKSLWKELRSESASGIKLFPAGKRLDEFRFMNITASIMLEDYDTAKSELIKITERTHDSGTLSRAIFLLAESEKKMSGNSKSYISGLKELAAGFLNSEIFPSVIFQLGVFYDEKKDYDRAYSAFSDIVEHYPDSPEADMSIQRIGKIKKSNPQKTSYIPDNLTVKNTEDLDLTPEYEVKKEKDENYYSVAVGPFTKVKDTSNLIKILKNYDEIRKVKTSYGYMIYIGQYSSTDSALETRIRLAEEYGINGNIVRFSVHEKKSYIYEDR